MSRKIFVIAGEASGDLLGGSLISDIKILSQDVEFNGVGGSEMIGHGLASIFPMTDLSVMGLGEVIRHLPRLVRRFHQTVDAILATNPDTLVTIDAPDFGLRVAKKIKKLRPDIRIIHYVAPSVWAWRPGRAKKISRFLDGLMCLFPFEPPYFTVHGLKAGFVGHPLAKTIRPVSEKGKSDFCQRYNIDPHQPVLCLLPGSRVREVQSLLPVLVETVRQLKQSVPGLQIILPTLPHLMELFHQSGLEAQVFVPADQQEKYTGFALSHAALHASGTVALELALSNTPMVTIYKVSPLTSFIVGLLVKTKFANLVNILLQAPVVPELIQNDAKPEMIVPLLHGLLTDGALRQVQKDQLTLVTEHLQEPLPRAAAYFVLNA